MIKLAIALCLLLGACASGESLEASISDTWDRTSELDVYVPSLNKTFMVNAESYANGHVDSDALTCEADTLVNMANGDRAVIPSDDKFYLVGGCRDVADSIDAVLYSECWTARGCEHLHSFDDVWMSAHGYTF